MFHEHVFVIPLWGMLMSPLIDSTITPLVYTDSSKKLIPVCLHHLYPFLKLLPTRVSSHDLLHPDLTLQCVVATCRVYCVEVNRGQGWGRDGTGRFTQTDSPQIR